MKYLFALIAKSLFYLGIFYLIIPLFNEVPFRHLVSLALNLSIITFLTGELFMLRTFGSGPTVGLDFGFTFLGLTLDRFFNSTFTVYVTMPAAFLSAVAVAAFEAGYHVVLRKLKVF